MKTQDEARYLTRDSVLKLLSDAEIASVSTAESAPRLAHGDEYLDLEHLDQGVQRAHGPTPHMGSVLPRKAIHAETWRKILKQLAAPRIALPHSGGRTDDSY
jgi:hypothetical protein